MKPYLLFFLLVFVSCGDDKEDPAPKKPNPFVGSWFYSYPSMDLEVSFDAFEKGSEISFGNVKVTYSEIPKGQVLNLTKVETFDKFEGGDGFGMMQISASNDVTWIIINLTYARLRQELGKVSMDVRELELSMINRQPILLKDQVFHRK